MPDQTLDKIIVTNGAALLAKYGESGLECVRNAVADMIQRDAGRGLVTTLVHLDDPAEMKGIPAPVVSKPGSPQQVKRAVDAIFKALRPDYLMILGAPDVVPQVMLRNPTNGGFDPDTYIPTDVPYACEAAYGLQAEHFRNPSRIIGRLPDVAGVADLDHFLQVIRNAANWRSRPANDYRSYFGLSAQAWMGSTQESLTNTFGGHAALRLSPPQLLSGYKPKDFRALSHFINCHGAIADPCFYGDDGGPDHSRVMPACFHSGHLAGKVAPGTVATAECCYGSLLYGPPDSADPSAPPIANSYLREGAYAFFGSGSVAYGPAVGNGAADLVCQYFLQKVLAGQSTGQAALEARQDFARNAVQLSPVDLKTIVQFDLIGDPSVHPVAATKAPGPKAASFAFAAGLVERGAETAGRLARRIDLGVAAEAIRRTVGVAREISELAVPKSMEAEIRKIAPDLDLDLDAIRSFEVTTTAAVQKVLGDLLVMKTNATGSKTRFHLVPTKATTEAMSRYASPAWPKGASPAWPKGTSPESSEAIRARLPHGTVVLIREQDGAMIGCVTYHLR